MSTPLPHPGPDSQASCFDPANPLLGPGPSRLDIGVFSVGNGVNAGVLTIRTPTTTVMIMLAAEELASWAQLITGLAAQVSGAGTALARPSPADISALSRNGRRS